MSEEIPYRCIPDYPGRVCAPTVVVRFLDSLAFRFRWATQDLRPQDLSFKPGPDTMTILDVTNRVWGLVNWIHLSLEGEPRRRPDDFESLRMDVLSLLQSLRDRFTAMEEEGLEACSIADQPFWHMLNGPISDALTHVGQINAFRRLSGNPTPGADIFRGLPPTGVEPS